MKNDSKKHQDYGMWQELQYDMRLFDIQVSKYINFCDEAQSLI